MNERVERRTFWPLKVVTTLLLTEAITAFLYLLLVADIGEFPEGPPNRLEDALGYTLMVMITLVVPSVVGGLLYAPILFGKSGRASRRRAVALSPVALGGVWLIVALGVQTLDAVIVTLAGTLVFGLVVPLPLIPVPYDIGPN